VDDPIFDPWSIGETEAASQPPSEQVPSPVPAQSQPRWRSALGAQGVPVVRAVPAPRPTAATGPAEFLRTLMMPRLEGLIQRLESARHDTTLDDRLDQPTPSLRFRVRPWQGPFDETRAEEGAVLEVLVDEGPPPEIIGRLWLNPLSTTPSEQSRVDSAKLTDAWVDRLLLEFVEKALRQE